jgi:uncharacterized membrane protein HdeD (DUF308 family)
MPSTATHTVNGFNRHLRGTREQIRRHNGWYVFEGVVFIIAGIAALALPGAAMIAVNALIGTLLVLSGSVQTALFLERRDRWWRLAAGLISLAIGFAMLFYPLTGIMTVSLLAGVFLALRGVTEIGMALVLKPYFMWGWLLFSGLLALFLAGLIFAFYPAVGMIYVVIAVAFNMIVYGASLLMLSSEKR